jgi:two-component system NtrC family sensor kinase
VRRAEKGKRDEDYYPLDESRYRELKRRHVVRLVITYLAPFVLLTAYLYVQYSALDRESDRLHLMAIAESQGNILDLFLTERVNDLSNVIEEPRMPLPPTKDFLEEGLSNLKRASDAFVDLGYFDSTGSQIAYVGPYPSLAQRSYASEPWFLTLKGGQSDFVITDIYLGFREIPHFTIGVSRWIDGRFVILRATLTPEKMYESISSFEGEHEVFVSIVNKAGLYQLVTPRLGVPLEVSSFVPPGEPRQGARRHRIEGEMLTYAYSWLSRAEWALIVRPALGTTRGVTSDLRFRMLMVAVVVFIVSLIIIFRRAGKLVEAFIESERNRLQLGQAAKLASVGELAAGIAHEINNPLAAISAEAGLVKDLMSPDFGEPTKPEELVPYLDSIQELVLRCRDITHKLLRFVRKTDVQLKNENLHDLIDEVLSDILGHELAISNVDLVKKYDCAVPEILTDGHQFQQVILNMVNNGIDAIGDDSGRITIATSCVGGTASVEISDTGRGMTPEQLEKVFLPFFTTKEVGKGTGLGLSVSYGIVKSLGGEIKVESELGRGTTFIVTLPKSSGRSH